MRDDSRVGSELRSLDHDRLRDNESRSIRPIPELGKQQFRKCKGDPTDRPEPPDHGDRDCAQVADREKPLF